MKSKLAAVELFNRLTGGFEPATLFHGVDQSNLDNFEQRWRPELKRRRDEFGSWTDAAKGNAQDSHWAWVEKAANQASYEAFAIEGGGETQGLMLIDVTTHFARIEHQKGLELAFIELLATAPWNRRHFVNQPKYAGVGTLLLRAAVTLSMELEFKGRVGLHSLPQADSWYDRLDITNLGHDVSESMNYYEMSEAQASAFLKD